MIEHKIGCLPVLEADHLVGIITETDILGEPWRVPRLYKIVGQAMGLSTFGVCPY